MKGATLSYGPYVMVESDCDDGLTLVKLSTFEEPSCTFVVWAATGYGLWNVTVCKYSK